MPDDKDDKSVLLPNTLDDLRGKTPDELRVMFDVVTAHAQDLHMNEVGELRDLNETEKNALGVLIEIRQAIEDRLAEHTTLMEVFRRRPKAVEQVYANLRNGLPDATDDVRRLTIPEARDRALRVLDDRNVASSLSSDQKDQVERYIRKDTDIARRILVTENEDYRTAWTKLVTDPHPMLTQDEQRAVQAYYEYRAMSEGVTTAGGFGVPVFIDPSIILTAQGTDNPFLTLASQKTVTTNAWKGVSSAGVTWSFQSEGVATTDNSPTLAQPNVPVYMARGFLPYSIEVGQDYPQFAEEMSTLLSSGYDELLVDKFTRGAGGLEPQGILTALSANTNVRVTVATAPTIAATDPYKVWAALPQRFRRKASWLMSVDINNAIRQLGAANVFHASTINLPEEWMDVLFNKGVYETPYMPGTTTFSTSTQGYAIVGDFSNYVVARRGGMAVELIPTLFDVTNNRPTGQRGWFAYARIGGGSANDLAFRVLTAS
jgi:HK97 family phage major capsid protein